MRPLPDPGRRAALLGVAIPLALGISACGDRQAQSNHPPTANQAKRAAAEFQRSCRKFLSAHPPTNPGRDILGIYPGMNAATAQMTLRCRLPDARLREVQEPVWYAPGKAMQALHIKVDGLGGDGTNEEVSFARGGARGDARVLYINRTVRYDGDARPDLEETLNGLEAKYGKRGNLRQEDRGTGEIVYTRSGVPLTDASSIFDDCIRVAARNHGGATNDLDPALCGLTIRYSVGADSDGRVRSMSLAIDNPADTSARILSQRAEADAERPPKSADF